MPEKITARFKISTPMFIGDAHQQASGISPAAVKGALRFWWRAMNWGRVRQSSDGDAEALRALHQQESSLFGTATDKGMQSSFRITVDSNRLSKTEAGAVHQSFQRHDAARYLGYGLMEAFASRKKGTHAGQLVRDCFNEEQVFSVNLLSRNKQDKTLVDAMIAFGLLGGLGSRARHGLGSVVLESIERDGAVIWSGPQNKQEYHAQLQEIIDRSASALPPYSAFAQSSRIDYLLTAPTPFKVLDDFANRMLLYRSWGRDGKVLGQPSERNFKPDHDWSKFDRPKDFHPRRIIFGLPHNYGPKANQSVTPADHDRRSSPLLLHVHKLGVEFVGVSVVFESAFLPASERINAGGKNVPAKIEWALLHEFLDGKDKQGNRRFAQRERLL